MKLNSLFRSALLLSMALSGFSCGSGPGNQQELLLGRWELDKATSNGKPTERLAGLFFVFDADGSMRTNLPLPGMKEDSRYELSGPELRQYSDETPDEVYYTIEEIGDSTMILNTELQNFRFSFLLRKRPATESQ